MKDESSELPEVRRRLLPHRLHARLIFFFLVVLLIPGILMPFFSLSYLRSMFLEAKLEESLLTVRQHTRLLEGLLEMRSVEVLMVSQMPEIRRFVNAPTEEARRVEQIYLLQGLQAYLLKRPDLIQGIQLLDAQGGKHFSIRETMTVTSDAVSRSGEDYFVGAMNVSAIRGQEIPVYVSHPTPESPIYYSSLILDDDGVIAGVLVLEVTLTALVEALKESTPGVMCQIFNAGRQSLLHPVTSEGAPFSCRLKSVLSEEELGFMLRHPLGLLSEHPGFEDHMLLFSRARPRGQSAIQWTVVYQIPLKPILGPFQQAAGMVGGMTLISMVVAVIIALGFSRQMTRPLTQLASAANDLCQGYWDTLLPETKYDDEVSELTVAFGTMCRQLKLAHEDLLKRVDDLHVSEQKQTQEKERLVVTLRSIGEAVIATDLEGRVEVANDKAHDLLGKRESELKGELLKDVLHLYNQTQGEPLGDVVALAQKNGEKVPEGHPELLLMRKEGEPLQVEVMFHPIRNEKSECFGVVIVIRDVTEMRKMLLERNRMDKLQSLGVLAGGVAHDFNNLVSVVMGDLSLLIEEASNADEARRIAQHALQATERARNLTGQLLTFSKGGAPIKKSASLRDLLTETADFALHGTKCTCEVRVQPH